MPSPKSGTAGTLVSPTAPTAATDATKDATGSNTTISNSGSKSGSAASSTTVGALGSSSSSDSSSSSSSSSSSNSSSSSTTAAASAAPAHKPADNPDKTSWIALQLIYESNGLPVAGMQYQVTLPDGTTVASGSTDDQGGAKVPNIDPGSCQISFPTLDQDAWEDA